MQKKNIKLKNHHKDIKNSLRIKRLEEKMKLNIKKRKKKIIKENNNHNG